MKQRSGAYCVSAPLSSVVEAIDKISRHSPFYFEFCYRQLSYKEVKIFPFSLTQV
jgi:hypothetical protein